MIPIGKPLPKESKTEPTHEHITPEFKFKVYTALNNGKLTKKQVKDILNTKSISNLQDAIGFEINDYYEDDDE